MTDWMMCPDAEVYKGVSQEALTAPIPSFNRLVTHPEFRGRGFSRMLDEVRLGAARLMGCRCVIGTADGQARLTQLREFGFQVVGSAPDYPVGHFLKIPNVAVILKLQPNATDFCAG